MKNFTQRERLMLAGLFLSKFSKDGLSYLGFSTFSEAYNAMGYALGGKPTSIKNYMQEFDPLYPNGRKGWHGRQMRDHCREAYDRYGDLPLAVFYRLLSPLLLPSTIPPLPENLGELSTLNEDQLENKSFSKRLITGVAAEGFFEASFPMLSDFTGHTLTNVTRFGCGFDFRIQPANSDTFLAAEVKGLAGSDGEIMMTSKEHRVAEFLRDRYYLCVVRNFSERPLLSIFQNPLEHGLEFTRRERQQISISYHTRISL